jgi:hypothetical protein
VSVVKRCKLLYGAWVECLQAFGFMRLEVLVLVVLDVVLGWGCCPLACRSGRVCVGRVVVPPCCSTHVSPSCPSVSEWSHRFLFPGMRACVHHQWCG